MVFIDLNRARDVRSVNFPGKYKFTCNLPMFFIVLIIELPLILNVFTSAIIII